MDRSNATSQIVDNSFKPVKKKKTSLETISCGVPQGLILGPLLFLLYVNEVKNTSNILDLIMFSDDTNLFFHSQRY